MILFAGVCVHFSARKFYGLGQSVKGLNATLFFPQREIPPDGLIKTETVQTRRIKIDESVNTKVVWH